MILFGEKVCIYRSKGKKKEWKELKAALREAGLKFSSHFFDDEMPVCGCGPKLDNRNFGANGKIDRTVYDVFVRKADEAKAEEIRDRLIEGYAEYETRC